MRYVFVTLFIASLQRCGMTQEIIEEIGICSNTVAELLQHAVAQV